MSDFRELENAFESRFVNVGGIETHYLDVGTGPPVILIHGGGAGADAIGNWYSCIPRLAEDFRVIVLDMVGFGRTGKPDPADFTYSQDARNDHLIGFIEALDIAGTSVIGNSMGGATATGACVKRPGLIGRLVLMGSAGLSRQTRPALRPLANYDFTREGMVEIVRLLAHESFVIDEDLIDYRHRLSVEPDTRAGYSATMAWIKEQGGLYYEEDFIRQVGVPTLVVGGKNDLVVPLELAFRFLELIDNSWGYFLPNCGHWAMLEHPDDFAAQTARFLSSH